MAAMVTETKGPELRVSRLRLDAECELLVRYGYLREVQRTEQGVCVQLYVMLIKSALIYNDGEDFYYKETPKDWDLSEKVIEKLRAHLQSVHQFDVMIPMN